MVLFGNGGILSWPIEQWGFPVMPLVQLKSIVISSDKQLPPYTWQLSDTLISGDGAPPGTLIASTRENYLTWDSSYNLYTITGLSYSVGWTGGLIWTLTPMDQHGGAIGKMFPFPVFTINCGDDGRSYSTSAPNPYSVVLSELWTGPYADDHWHKCNP
jgi:hypothetical protein